MTSHRAIEGHCHCQSVTVRVELTDDPPSYAPRSCDCDFCRMHNASYLSDPNGRLRIQAADTSALGRYRQGAELADMLFCSRCGVLVGACYEAGSELFAAVNARLFTEPFGTETTASPKKLDPDEKTKRWKQLWFGDVKLDKGRTA